MSLHLIESRKVPAANSRKRGGMIASVLLHAMLITSAVTLATAAPLPVTHVKTEPTIYVAPEPKQRAVPKPVLPTESHTTPNPQAPLPQIPQFPVEIPTTIPNQLCRQQRHLARSTRTGNGTGDGSATDACCGTPTPGRFRVSATCRSTSP